MAYNASYNTEDVTEVTIDGIVVFGIAVVSLAGIIALVFLYKWVRKSL